MSAEESKTSPAGAGADESSKNAGTVNQQRGGSHNKQKKQKQNQHQNNSDRSTFKGEVPELGAIMVGETAAKTKSFFDKVDKSIKLRIGREMDQLTLQSINAGEMIKPDEYDAELKADGNFKDAKEKLKYEIHYSKNLKREELVENELTQVFHLYIGQCSDEVKSTLKEHEKYDEMEKKMDVFLLRKMLLNLSVGFKSTKQPVKTLFVCLREFMMIRQHKGEPNATFLKRFKDLKATVQELIGGDDEPFIYAYLSLLKMHCKSLNIDDHTKLDGDTKTEYMTLQQSKMEAMHFVLASDQDRYGGMIQDFDRAYLSGVDKYPVTLIKAYNLLNHWHADKRQKKRQQVTPSWEFRSTRSGIRMATKTLTITG